MRDLFRSARAFVVVRSHAGRMEVVNGIGATYTNAINAMQPKNQCHACHRQSGTCLVPKLLFIYFFGRLIA